MSAPILRPGDHIHLALPLGGPWPDSVAKEEAERQHKEFVASYARYGVTLATVSFNSQIAAPVVVAIFRSEVAP